MATGSTRNRYFIETRRLDQNILRLSRNLGRSTAHDTSKTDNAGIIGNHDVLWMQVAFNAVQSRQLLPCDCSAHHDFSLYLIGIIEVQRLTSLKHHVIGNINWQRDRTHTR